MKTHFKSVDVDGIRIAYREAGDPSRPTVLLLHGFPSAGHMFRDLIPELADDYHVVAPDLPGFGQSGMPSRDAFTYTFDNLGSAILGFIDSIGLREFALYVFDYGAPIGFRLMLAYPERVIAIISQNGNFYREGLSEVWRPIQAYWADPSPKNREALRPLLGPKMTLFQYTDGVQDPTLVSPDGRTLDDYYLSRPGNAEIQLDLFLDYQTNVALYEQVQAYLRRYKPPVLAVWGRHDPFFLPAGADAFTRDIPAAQIRFLETGHFALETHAVEIGSVMKSFLSSIFA